MSLEGCKSLRELPNFTRIPNLEELNLVGCESLVEVHQSVGSLDKLVTLDLGGCSNLVKLPTEISLKSLRVLYLSGCTSLKYLPFSIYGLQNLETLNVSGCTKLVTLPTKASISHDHDSGSLVLPKLRVLRINGCNLSTADFIVSLDCLETLTELDLSSNNFVSVPALCKFVNLPRIDLYCCKRLLEIPELPPNILEVNARDCKSLEGFFILPKSLNMLEMLLWNCHRFSYSLCYDMMENILLNNQNNSPFKLGLLGCEVPKWFHFSKEVAAYEYGLSSACAISFEIPSKLNWENIGVAFCSVGIISTFFMDHRADISIKGFFIDERFYWRCPRSPTPIGHMWLTYIPLANLSQTMDI
ncbi:disease resistance protein TAO1-like [Rosa chinensis]|uniref:disease resistance protein TAO1-like n=1 Tax=Rosa chinensis TaxID=74649 RepID=UPI001AD8E6EF|nr:disease resistance protein TAO1-like [Rosa chinensis]